MSHSFNAQKGLVILQAEVTGPGGSVTLHLGLDTGATWSLINVAPLVALGYDPALAPQRLQVTTASGVEFLPRLPLTKISALGHDRLDFPVLCHTLPTSAPIDGLLGLDFLRGHVLTVDFQSGEITLI
jgi:aspartyl protease